MAGFFSARHPRRYWQMLLIPSGILFIPFYLALFLLVLVSFLDNTALNGQTWRFTLANYQQALLEPYYLQVLWSTLLLSCVISVICIVLALPIAWHIVRTRHPVLRLLLIICVILPFMLNSMVRLFALMALFGREGGINVLLGALHLISRPVTLLRTEFAVAAGQIYFLLPFAIMTLSALFARLPQSPEKAASTLGASDWRVFIHITLPAMKPAILAALVITYSLSVSAFVVPLVLGGDRYKMYANLIYQQVIYANNFPLAAAMSVILLVFSLLLIALYRRVLRMPTGRRRG